MAKIRSKQYFTAKELTVDPGVRCRITDQGAYGLVCTQGQGTINGQPLNSPKMIRFQDLTEDEYFCAEQGAKQGWYSSTPVRPNPWYVFAILAPKLTLRLRK